MSPPAHVVAPQHRPPHRRRHRAVGTASRLEPHRLLAHVAPSRRCHRSRHRCPGRHRHACRMGRHRRGTVGHREDHALRRVGVSVADRRRGEGLRRFQMAVGEGSAPLRHFHPLRTGRDDGSGARRQARRLHRRQGTGRRLHRFRHRRIADDRGHAESLSAWRPAQDFTILRTRVDHQYGCGSRIDPLWLQGTESRHRQRVFDRQPQLGRSGAPDRIRRCRHHDCRRRRSDRLAARRRRLLRCTRAVTSQRRSGDGKPALGRRPRRFRAGRGRRHSRAGRVRARARRAARASTASSPATA